MTRLDDYRSALLVARPDAPEGALDRVLDEGGPAFAEFIVDHGLGPMWHARTGNDAFHGSRVTAEALYMAQDKALHEIDELLGQASIDYAVIKGGASRLQLYDNPAVRACYDLDLLIRPEDRSRAASALAGAEFSPHPISRSISRTLVLSRSLVDVDLHWGLLREGRLRRDLTSEMLDRRRRQAGVWMLNAEDTLFVLLVHPVFAKHLGGWDMGLHRVVDVILWLRTQTFDWPAVIERLDQAGVRTAAWATLRWVQLLTQPDSPGELDAMLAAVRPGPLRCAWLDRWLRRNLSERMSQRHWVRLLAFSLFLHDTLRDSIRALFGRYRAHRRRNVDWAAFGELFGQ
jgi:hypothetical protein